MTERQFSELRPYADTEGSCIDMGFRPLESLISNRWLFEVVSGCWRITPAGLREFRAVVDGSKALTAEQV